MAELCHPNDPLSLVAEFFMGQFGPTEFLVKRNAGIDLPHMQRDMSEIHHHHGSLIRLAMNANRASQVNTFAIIISLTKLPSTNIESRFVPSMTYPIFT